MVRPNRIKQTSDSDFTIADLTCSAGGNLDVYSENPINGFIQGVYWKGSNYTATGSIIFTISGIEGGTWLGATSGTNIGHTVVDAWAVFPRTTTVSTASIPISGADGYDEFAEIPVNSVIRIWGSGLGASKSGLGVNIIYA